MPGLVVELAGESLSLELLALDDPAERISCDPPREIDGDRRPRRELLRQPQVGVGEARVRAELVVGDHDADRLVAHEQRHEQAGPGAEQPRGPLIDLRVVEHRIDPLAAPALEHTARLRPVAGQANADQHLGALAGRRLDEQLVSTGRKHDRHETRVDEVAEAAATRCKRRPRSSSPTSALPISFSDSSCRDQPVAASYSRAFSIATAACDASSVSSSSSSSVKSPVPFSVR